MLDNLQTILLEIENICYGKTNIVMNNDSIIVTALDIEESGFQSATIHMENDRIVYCITIERSL